MGKIDKGCNRCGLHSWKLYITPLFKGGAICGACINSLSPWDHSYCAGSREYYRE